MFRVKKFSLILLLVLTLSLTAGMSYAAEHYATTDMTFAEFYAGELGVNASDLAVSYDAVTTATQRFVSRFNGLIAATSGDGSVFSGVKAVQVRMSDEVYNALRQNTRYTVSTTEFTEYKDVASDGSFSAMVSKSKDVSGVTVALSGGKSNGHGNYRLTLTGLSYDQLGVDLGGTSLDNFLGATLKTSDGTVYGLKPLHNLWIRGDLAEQIGFSVEDFSERNGTHLSYAHTADLPGKTITSITYMFKNQPDLVIPAKCYVNRWTDASITVPGDVKSGKNIAIHFTSKDIPTDAKYVLDSVAKVEGRNSTPLANTDYTYANSILTLNNAEAGSYTATFKDSSDTPYVDITVSITVSDYYATTNMTWAEFYAGETKQTAAALEAAGLDAISTPTTAPAYSRFPLLWGVSSPDIDGTILSGEKDVQVRMTGDVYNALTEEGKSRFTFTDEAFTEYKQVNADGSFGKMVTETVEAPEAVVTLASGASSTWGHYTFSITSADIDIGLSDDKIARNYLGAYLETKNGKIYGLRHDNNLWSDAGSIAFCISDDYVEPHGRGVQRSWKYTADLAGETITKITYMLKGLPDVVINCEVKVPAMSTATAEVSSETAITAGKNVSIPITITGSPSGVVYDVVSLYSGSGRNRIFITDYTYENNILTINGEVASGDYTAILRSDGYSDIAAHFTVQEDGSSPGDTAYHYATTDMTWAEFYAGETGTTASALEEAGLDAVSSPTARIAGRFTQLVSTENASGGADILGVKDVQVRMTPEVYAKFKDDSRYTFTDTEFTEYKEVAADGSFGEMLTEYDEQSATVTLGSGQNATWGNYMLNVSGVDISLGSGDTSDYLGVLITTDDGKVYGLRHNSNLWFSAGDIALTYKAFTEPHGIDRDYDYTSDLEGKTVTKIQYMLKNKPDVVVSCNVYLKEESPASVSASYPEGYNALLAEEGNPVTITFTGLPEGVTYDIFSVTPSIRHAAALDPENYDYADGKLTFSPLLNAGNYKAVFSTERYSDLAVTVELFTTTATDLIVSSDKNAAGLTFLLTPAGKIDAVDAELAKNKFANASDYTNLDENYTEDYTSGTNEIAGSGFTFDVVLNGVSDDYTGIVGFGKIFTMTRETLGSNYDKIFTAINSTPVGESGWIEFPTIAELNSAGLRAVQVMADGTERDISNLAGTGAMINDGAIMLFYGIMAADSSTVTEGEYMLSPEGETLVNDGARDGHIKVTMYLATIPADSSEPGNEEPGSEEPGSEEPGSEEPGSEEPGSEEPGSEEPGEKPSSDLNTTLNLEDTTLTSKILQGISKTTSNPEVAKLPDNAQGSSRTESDLTAQERSAISSVSEDVALVLPEMSVEKSAVYVWGVDLKGLLDAGARIFLHMFNENGVDVASFEAAANGESYMFLDDNGQETQIVPDNQHVNIAAYLEAGETYSPVITTEGTTTGPGSSGGGCNAGFTMLALAGIAVFVNKHHVK